MRDLRSRAKSLLSEVVKLRDGRCGQCAWEGKRLAGRLDAGHLFAKSCHPGTAYDPEALVGQCRSHNTAHIGNPERMHRWFRAVHGAAKFEELKRQAKGPGPTREELGALIVRLGEMKAELTVDREAA